MSPPQLLNLVIDPLNIMLRLLNGSHPVALASPTSNVFGHLAYSSVLLGDLLANLARRRNANGFVDELEPARLACAVLLVALLAEVSPLPVAAGPEGLLEVAHFFCFGWW